MSDTFAVGQATAERWNLNGVAVSVNGEPSGTAQATDTLAAVVQRYASSKGIQSATVYAGERKLLPSQGSQTMQALGVTAINIVTKDQRAGFGIWSVK